MSKFATRDQLADSLRPAVEESGLELEDVEVTSAGRRRVVRVIVDKDGGVTLDEIADSTRAVSRRLDSEAGLLGETPYTLEVTSPGTDRPLTQPRHWRRNIGRLVKVKRNEGDAFTGRVLDAGEVGASLDVGGEQHELAYAEVATALVQVEFKREGG